MIPIPEKVAARIDKIAGQKHRSAFVVDLLEQEIERREQLAALSEAIGCWSDKDHPELSNGSEAFVRELRDGAAQRLEKIEKETFR
jgi:hypothetical protein